MSDPTLEAPEEAVAAAVRTWLEGLALGVDLVQVTTGAPSSADATTYPRVEAYASVVEWTPWAEMRPARVLDEFGEPTEVEAFTEDGARVWDVGDREAEMAIEFYLARRADAASIRAKLPRAIVFGAVRDPEAVGGVRLVTRIPGVFHGQARAIVVHWTGRDTLETPEDTGQRDRWILRCECRAAYPWLEREDSPIGTMDLAVQVNDGDPVELNDLEDLAFEQYQGGP